MGRGAPSCSTSGRPARRACARAHRRSTAWSTRSSVRSKEPPRRVGAPKGAADPGRVLSPDTVALLVAGLNRDRLIQLRDSAYFLVAHKLFARGTDVENLLAENLTLLDDGSFDVVVVGSKSDPVRVEAIPHDKSRCTARCPACALRRWLDASHITSGPLFRPVYQDHVRSTRLHKETMNPVLQRAARAVCGETRDGRPGRWGRHMIRRSAFTQACEAGLDVTEIAVATNTTVDNVRRYTARRDCFEEQAHLDLSDGTAWTGHEGLRT